MFNFPVTLVPAYGLTQPWTLITTTLVESNPVFLLINLVSFLYMASYFERRWGLTSFLVYFCVVSLSVELCALLVLITCYIFTYNTQLIFQEINGMGGYLCALVVAFKQVIPQHNVKLFNTISVRVKHIPSLVLAIHFILFIFGFIFLRTAAD
jgi:membrane associated rhomboid family serine protease